MKSTIQCIETLFKIHKWQKMTQFADEDDVYEEYSDNEISNTEHPKLLAAVTQLDGKQRVRPPSRKEPSLQVSEFHLVQSGLGEENAVELQDLAKVLESRASHTEIGRKLKSIKKKTKTLPRPLEKPVAQQIQRSVGFAQVKKQISRWDAVVHKNRAAEQLIFPLNQGSVKLDTSSQFVTRFKTQSPLESQMAEILNSSKVVEEEREEQKKDFPLSLEELIQRRKEMAHLRAQQSYQEAKARRQGKIKSKAFHRVQRRERTRKQLKDFEALQKTDPEAALKQLELLERTRAEERMTLRHRSTGQWARNRAVRAKYDPQSRQVLAEQLAISRDLTQKVRLKESSDDEEEEAEGNFKLPMNTDNPWMASKTESEVQSFVSGYRKYWEERQKKETIAKQTQAKRTEQCNEVQPNKENTEARIVTAKEQESQPLPNLDGQKKQNCIDITEQNNETHYKENSAIATKKSKKCKPKPGTSDQERRSVSKKKGSDGQSTTKVLSHGAVMDLKKAQSKNNMVVTLSKGSSRNIHKKSPQKSKGSDTAATVLLVNSSSVVTGIKKTKMESAMKDKANGVEQKSGLMQKKAVKKQSKTKPLLNMKSTRYTELIGTEANCNAKIQKSLVITENKIHCSKTVNDSVGDPHKTHKIVEFSLSERGGVKGNKDVIQKNAVEGVIKKKRLNKSECLSEPSLSRSVGTSNEWVVTPINSPVNTKSRVKRTNKIKKVEVKSKRAKIEIDHVFGKMEEKLQKTVAKKLAKWKHDMNIVDEDVQEELSDTEGPSLAMKRSIQHPREDVELLEETGRSSQSPSNKLDVNRLSKVAALVSDTGGSGRGGIGAVGKVVAVQDGTSRPGLSDVDPSKFMAVKPRRIKTQLPEDATGGDEVLDDDQEDQRMTISEAFAEDDVVAEFRKEKEEAVEKSKPQDIDLTLPGWGSWGGKNLSIPKRKKRRFIIKFPEVAPRKDQNKGDLILNEDKDTHVKQHQVSELPFPFTSVKDFEASIRAPIGNTFVPETAHRRLIKPHIITRLGTIIQPMDEEVLVDKKKKMTFV